MATRQNERDVALERSLVLYVIDAGVAVKWFIPEEISLRGISSI